MSNYLDLNMEPGVTLKGTDDSGYLLNAEVLGKVFYFPYGRYGSGNIRSNKERQTGWLSKAVAVRNQTGLTLAAKRVCILERTAGFGVSRALASDSPGGSIFGTVSGYCHNTAQHLVGVVDPFIPSGGVADNDIFLLFIGGPCIVKSTLAGGATNVITVGAPVVAATAATSGADTAGYVEAVTLPGQTGATNAFQAAIGVIGYAASALTTANTGSDLLVNLCCKLH